jgi:hypothetical protein
LIQLAIVLIFAVLSGQVVLPGPAQAPPRDRVPPPRTGTGIVKGRVVDGTTGAAIARARVMLQGLGGGGAPAITDADGGFTFTGLPPGPVMVMVQKSTYLAARYPAPGRTMRSQARPIILRDAQVLDNVVVPMFHGASFSGRVFDANGDPVDYAQVSLLRMPGGGRTGKPMMREGTQTNDLGEFRLGRLEAGTYLVQVNARRPDEMPFSSNAPLAPQTPPSAQPLPTFYPSALAMDQAQPIAVDRAQAVSGIDVVLAEGIPGIVTGTITLADGQPLPLNTFPSVMVRRAISDVSQNWFDYTSGASTRPDGTFRAVLPPGDYMLEARLISRTGGSSRPEDEQLATARVSVVSGGEESLSLTVGPAASATGRVIFEGTTPVPAAPGRTRVPMFSNNGMCRAGEAEVAPDWTFRIAGLNGTCSAEPRASFGRWMVKSVIVNGENVLDSPVTFQPGQRLRNVQVIVTDRQSSMTFDVSDENGQTTRDYVVLAYPVDREGWSNGARIYMAPTIPNLEVSRGPAGLPAPAAAASMRPQVMLAVRSGDYYVIAVDDLEQDDVRDPIVLERLRSSATRVTIAEGAAIQMPLRRVNFADVMRQK